MCRRRPIKNRVKGRELIRVAKMVHLDGKIISEGSDGRGSFGKNEREFGEAVAVAAHPSAFAIRRNTPAAAAAGGNSSSKNSSSKSTTSPRIIHSSPALHLHASSHLNPLQNSLQTPFQIPSIRIWPSISPIGSHPANHFSALPCWSIDGTNPTLEHQKATTMSTEELRPIFEDNESRQKSLTSTEEGGDGVEQCRRENGLSAFPTALNFVKGMLGPGCLSIPLIFRQSGWLAGLFLVFLFGLVSTKCMLQLVNCSQHLSKKKRHQHLDYGDVAFEACAQSFSRLRPYKRLARIAVNASIASLQVGICSVSVVFLAAHIKEISEELFAFNLSQQQWILVIAIPLILINFIRTLHKIVFLSIIGSFLMLTALAIIFQHLIRAKHVPLSDLPLFTDLNGIISASGAVLYAYEGQAMVLPLENKLRVPSQMGGPCGILAWSMSFVSLIYALCGFAGYATYGQKVEGSIALNLPSGEILFTSVRFMLTLVVFFGFVMQQYVIVEMIWPKLAKMLGNNNNNANKMFAREMAFRASLVILAVAIAFAVPNLERIIPLVGMSAGMLLAIVFPSFLDTLTFLPAEIERREWDKIVFRLIQNGILAIIGLFSLIGGVEANLMELIKPKG